MEHRGLSRDPGALPARYLLGPAASRVPTAAVVRWVPARVARHGGGAIVNGEAA